MSTTKDPNTRVTPGPASTEPGAIERHSIDFIPESERHGHARNLFPMWFGANCMAVTITTGALATVAGLSFLWAAIATTLGLLIGGVFMAYHSAQGPQLGLPQMIQSRAQFGFFGANLPLLIAIAMYLGFFASGGVLGGQAIAALLGVSVPAGILLASAANVVLVLLGYRAIHAFERAVTPIFIVLFAMLTVVLLTKTPTQPTEAPVNTHAGFSGGPFLATIAMSAIYLISYAPYVADYSRYLPRNTRVAPTFWYTYGGVVLSGVWMMLLGAGLQGLYPKLDVTAQIAAASAQLGGWFKILILLAVSLGIVGINALNIYGAFMSSLTFATSYFRRWSPTVRLRVTFIVPITVVGTWLAFLEKDSLLSAYEVFLGFLLYFLIPWTAVNLADFYLVRHGDYDVTAMFDPRGHYGRFNAAGLTAYLVGCLAQVPFISVDFYEGPAAKALGGGDISWIVGIVVSGLLYLIFTRRIARTHA
jgi:NCS1 family nucleobase:cation symporter-1